MKFISGVLPVFCFMAVGTAVAQAGDSTADIVGAYNSFGFKTLAQTRRIAPGKNVFLSPTGLAFALSMVADGAQGKTRQEMMDTMQLKDAGPDLNQANEALLEHLTGLDAKIKLEIANSVWTAADANVKPDFLAVIRQDYHGEVASVDFHDPATAGKINGWVSDHTAGKIQKMVEPPLDGNRLILLDAIYFKGDWMTPFDKKLTHDLPFTLGDGQTVSHPRMSRTGRFEYYEDEACQAVRLPYAGRAMSLYVFLPRQSLDQFLPTLTLENWRQWTRQLRSRRGTVELPRLKLKNDYNLKDVLQEMGMREAFSPRADFHGIADESLHIDWIRQKTYVEVNEQGTEAAAATGVGVFASVVQREGPFRLIVDRPFFLALCDNQSGAILFLGAIMDPRS